MKEGKMHIKKELMISGSSVAVDFEVLTQVRELMTEFGVDVLKLINGTQWEVLIFEELMAEDIDVHSIKGLRLVINGITDNKSGKAVTVPLNEVSEEKPMCDITDSGVVLTGFTMHYWIFKES